MVNEFEGMIVGESDVPEAYITFNFKGYQCGRHAKFAFQQTIGESYKLGIDMREELPDGTILTGVSSVVWKKRGNSLVDASADFPALADAVETDSDGVDSMITTVIDGTVAGNYVIKWDLTLDNGSVIKKEMEFKVRA